jgi:hypothetical protein
MHHPCRKNSPCAISMAGRIANIGRA